MASRDRLVRGFAGLAIAVGTAATLIALFAWEARTPASRASGLSGVTTWGMLLAPFLFLYGIIASVRGFLSASPIFSKRSLFFTGLLMLILGACPWAYTRYIIGGSPGNEGAGMLGTMIFVFVGLPGLALTVIGLVAGWLNED